MLDKYNLMHRDVPVGDLTYDTSKKKFTFEEYDSIKDRNHLPLGIYSFENWNIDYKVNNDDIAFCLEIELYPRKELI